MKTTIALLALFAVVLGGGYGVYSYTHQPEMEGMKNMPADSMSTSTAMSAGSTTSGSESATVSSVSSTTTITTTTVAPKPATTTPKPGTYTSAQVATHNTSTSCWTSINGNVYNLTSWIPQHPGGEARILSICGKDGTVAFEGQHSSDPRPQQVLATFKIGTLAS